jgi:FAD/FMN-containing dehydrogenase
MSFTPALGWIDAMARLPDLAEPDDATLGRLAAALGSDAVSPPEPRHLEEPRGVFTGEAAALLRPRDTASVAAAVRLCAEARIGIVPYGGGTGLVAGQVRAGRPRPVILSLERMAAIRDVNVADGVLTAEAGAILVEAQAAAEAAGLLFPLSLASEGSARIGGLLATNAGGINVLRYGNTRELCLGVEAVLADGAVFNGLSSLRKDNTGYDLKGLLIGSEGTLGVITAASLRLFPLPAETAAAWVAVPSLAAALTLLGRLREALGETISAFEIMHGAGLAFLAETMPEVPQPLPERPLWSVMAEAGAGSGLGLADRLESALADAWDAGVVTDALVAQNAAQRDAFWRVRESMPEANRRIGSISSHDISVPPSRIAAFVERGDRAIAAIDPDLRINCFGHLGDGNLHYNVFPPAGRDRADYASLLPRIKAEVYEACVALGGSISAEHGIGRLRKDDLERYVDPVKIRAMRAIKDALDPLGILNPGALLPDA